ncbi:MAG: PCMD domain-containing protein, partial [Bacteroidales bacterium]|nr:PCMD domain-containing protein [Bacteroidales bacterium]
VETVLCENGRYCAAPITHKATLGYIVECLHKFHEQPSTLIMPSIPDGSFENDWFVPANTIHNYDEYQNDLFYTLNELSEEPEVDKVTTFKSTDAQDGSFALKLVTKDCGWIVIPGAMGTIPVDFIGYYLDSNRLDLRRPFEFTARPTAFEGYYKYAPVAGDSAAIEVGIYDDKTEMAGMKFVTNDIADEWTKFSIPLTYNDEETMPNMVKIIFAASAGYNFDALEECDGRDGSALWIDHIAFLYDGEPSLGLREELPHSLSCKAYPVPATDNITFDWGVERNLDVVVYSITGAVVARESVNASSCSFNISDIEAGNYFYRLIDGNNILGAGKFVVTRK